MNERDPAEASPAGRPAVFFDRDGTLMENRHYLADPEGVAVLPGAAAAVRAATERGFVTVLVTNQSGVARGLMSEDDVRAVNDRLVGELESAGARLDAVYYCPHHPIVGESSYTRACDCRKPAPGMIVRAAAELGLDLSRSVLVGDSTDDMAAAAAAGIRALLVTGVVGPEEAVAELLGSAEAR